MRTGVALPQAAQEGLTGCAVPSFGYASAPQNRAEALPHPSLAHAFDLQQCQVGGMAERTCMGSGAKGTQLHLFIMKRSFPNANVLVQQLHLRLQG